MDEPRDDVDIWLSERVTPLLPHPGAFERIRKRARRRKLGQAAIAAGGAAVIVAAAATVPQLLHSRPTGYPYATNSSKTPQPTRSPAPSPSHTRSSPSPASNPTPSTLPPAVPPNFAVSSVTFVSLGTGWVIGQAGTPGQCTGPRANICTSRAITVDGGGKWRGGPAPLVGPPNGSYGVSQIRALDGLNAWAFGPQLYATHDGGNSWQSWRKIDTHGMRVTDLETVNGRVFAVWARCTGAGPDFAANCTSFSLYSSSAYFDSWAPVPGVPHLTSSPAAGVPAVASSAQLVLAFGRGYLLAPSGRLYSGPDTGAGWKQVSGLGGCGEPGPAQADGVPANTMLASTGAGLVELCAHQTQGSTQVKQLFYSADGGRSWQQAGQAPLAGIATSLSGSPAGRVVVATTTGIDVSANVAGSGPSGLLWRAVRGASAPGGFSYVGMTSSGQGVAIPADQGLHAVWFTYDGGKRWRESLVQSPG
jgi:hypothetical protein